MMASLSDFSGGSRSARSKLNAMVAVIKSLLNLKGDQFVVVRQAPGGFAFSLAIEQVIARMPKVLSEGGVASATFALITSKIGSTVPYRYTAVQAVMDVDGNWDEGDSGSAAESYENVFNLEEQGSGGQWVNPLLVGDVVLLFPAPGGVDAYVCIRNHYRGTY